MEIRAIPKLLIVFTLPYLLPLLAYAGNTVMTTSDQGTADPTYNKGTEVVIQPTTTVTLTTSVQNGTVYVSYNCSSGVTCANVSGQNTATQTAVFSFDSTTYGQINTIQLVAPNHTVNGVQCNLANNGAVTYKICIPKITVPQVTGRSTSNHVNSSSFFTRQTISGCDDFSQIKFQQLLHVSTSQCLQNSTTWTQVNGRYATNSGFQGDGGGLSPWACPNAGIFQVTGNSTALINNDIDLDRHWTGPGSSAYTDITISAQDYSWTYLWSHSADFEDCIQRSSDSVTLDECEFDWGYTWDNLNEQWSSNNTTNTNTPAGAPPATNTNAPKGNPPISSNGTVNVSFGGSGNLPANPGEYSGEYGIDYP